MSERDRPMPMAELDECCGQLQLYVDRAGDIAVREPCDNCPALIERKRERVMRHARAS